MFMPKATKQLDRTATAPSAQRQASGTQLEQAVHREFVETDWSNQGRAASHSNRPPSARHVPLFSFGKVSLESPVRPSPATRLPLQAKLNIGAINDPLEQEADKVADQVLRMAAPQPALTTGQRQVSRQCEKCEEEEGKLQKKEAGPRTTLLHEAPSSVYEVLRSPGRTLDAATRAFFEPRFGYDFANVRIHDGDQAAHSAHSVGALAYTVGQHIVFGRDQLSTGADAGRQLLAHELAHTVQQGSAQSLDASSPRATSTGPTLQRQEDPRVHAPAAPYVSFEKSSPDIEAMYRRNGLTEAANAVRRCRLEGACAKVLTSDEAYEAYRTGRLAAGKGDENSRPTSTGAAAAPIAAGMLAPSVSPGAAAGAARTASSLERAREAWQTAEVLQGGEAAVGGAAAPGAAGAATVAIPVAIGIYVVVAVADLIGYASFQSALQRQGYVILPHPLQVCISGCHQPAAPSREFDDTEHRLPRFPDMDEQTLRDWMQPSTPAPLPPTQPAAPQPDPPTASRQRPARSAPTPSPSPTPTPATPWPRSTRCTPEEQTSLHDEVEKQCKNRGAFACKPGDSISVINEKIAKLNACIDARERYQKKCWQKGDPLYEGHMQQIADLYAILRNCENLAKNAIRKMP